MREGWGETTLGDVADFINGYPFKPADLGDDGSPVIRIQQLLDPSVVPDRTTLEIDARNRIDDGDLIFSWSGTLAAVEWNRGPAYLNQHLFKVIERDGFTRAFVRCLLVLSIPALNKMTHGTTMKHITKRELQGYRVPQPPLKEQHRIVDLMNAVDAYVAAAEARVEAARIARSALLRDLLSKPGEDWVDTTLGEVAQVNRGFSYSASNLTGDGALIGLKAISPGGGFRSDGLKPFSGVPRDSQTVTAGDLVVANTDLTRDEGILGCPALIPAIPNTPLVASHHITIVRPDESLTSPRFLSLALLMPAARSWCKAHATGTTVRGLSSDAIRGINLCLPGLRDQVRINEVIASADHVVETGLRVAATARIARRVLLTDLLSGNHEIPASYDRFFEAA